MVEKPENKKSLKERVIVRDNGLGIVNIKKIPSMLEKQSKFKYTDVRNAVNDLKNKLEDDEDIYSCCGDDVIEYIDEIFGEFEEGGSE